MLTAAADTIATMLGNASDSITGSTGPWVNRSVGEGNVAACDMQKCRCAGARAFVPAATNRA